MSTVGEGETLSERNQPRNRVAEDFRLRLTCHKVQESKKSTGLAVLDARRTKYDGGCYLLLEKYRGGWTLGEFTGKGSFGSLGSSG